MKIIQSSRRGNKDGRDDKSPKSIDTCDDIAQKVAAGRSAVRSESNLNTSKPQSKKQRNRPLKKRPKQSSIDSKPSLENGEQEFDFDTSRLEAMPKDEIFEAPVEGKTRRRSELQAEKASEPLSLVIDPEKKEFNELFARGLRLLAMREHSVQEITKKLFDKSEDSDAIYAVVDDLLDKKYLSDERFTEVYIRSRRNRGFGPVKIKAELKDKGVSNNLIQDYLGERSAGWFDAAKFQYEKKYGGVPISDYNAWSKRARFMQSRGFSMEHIHVIVPRIEFD